LKTATIGFSNHDGVEPLFEALELAREQLGLHHCDQRMPKTILASEFPDVVWPASMPVHDSLWTEVRETKPELVERALATLRVLSADEAPRLALVTHSSFLKAMFAVAMDFSNCAEADQSRLAQWFETGELRTLVVNLAPIL
jgi:broad specificity phosphatase PhoE